MTDEMIEIEVKLYGQLRQYRPKSADGAPHHPFLLSLPDTAKMADVVAALGIDAGLTAVFSQNGDTATLETPLLNSAKVSLFPPTAGGA